MVWNDVIMIPGGIKIQSKGKFYSNVKPFEHYNLLFKNIKGFINYFLFVSEMPTRVRECGLWRAGRRDQHVRRQRRDPLLHPDRHLHAQVLRHVPAGTVPELLPYWPAPRAGQPDVVAIRDHERRHSVHQPGQLDPQFRWDLAFTLLLRSGTLTVDTRDTLSSTCTSSSTTKRSGSLTPWSRVFRTLTRSTWLSI